MLMDDNAVAQLPRQYNIFTNIFAFPNKKTRNFNWFSIFEAFYLEGWR